jgi:hypothetical protein
MPTIEPDKQGLMILDKQCVAASTVFARASLARFREAEAPGLEHTPEAAVLRRRAQIYSDLMQDMLALAVEHAAPHSP